MRILSLVLAAGIAASILVLPGAPAAAQNDDASRHLTVTPQAFGVLHPGDALVVTGAMRNTSDLTLPVSDVTVHLGRAPFLTEATLGEWFAGTSDAAVGAALATTSVPTLEPGATASFTLTVPAESLDLGPAGAYALEVRSDDASAHSALTWLPDTPERSRLTMLWPLTAPPTSTGLLDADEVALHLGPNGILTRALDQLSGLPPGSVTVGVDPMIIASVRLLGSSAPPEALAWLDRLAALPLETFALAYADANPAVGAAMDVLEPLTFRIDPALFGEADPDEPPTPSPAPVVPTPEDLLAWDHSLEAIAWPAAGSVTVESLDSLVSAGYETVVVDSRDLDAPRAARGVVDLGDLDGLIADGLLSELLAEALSAPSESAWLTAMAQIAAASVASTSDTVVAAFPRVLDTGGLRLGQTVRALLELPWLGATPLSEVLTGSGANGTITGEGIPADHSARIGSLVGAERAVAEFASALVEPQQLTGPRRLALLGLLGNGWHADVAGWGTASAGFLTDCNNILGAVQVQPSSTINLLSDNGPLPVTVSNDLAHPVTVYVTVRSNRAILDVMDSHVELTVEASSQAKAFVPVQTVANGSVTTVVTLASPTGVAIGAPLTLTLNVQAGWETAATVVIGALVVLVFIAGLTRTVLRRRRVRRVEA